MIHRPARMTWLRAFPPIPGAALIEHTPGPTRGDEHGDRDGDETAGAGSDRVAASRRASTSGQAPLPPPLPPRLRRSPDRPGRWRLVRPDGTTAVLRVIDRNGQLYVVRGRLFSVAVPIAHFEGDWTPLG